jgi:phenol/toluene 2-monooxygenase (NADH) P4/A4
MTVKALYDYDYPSASRQELYGDDLLVSVEWAGNVLLCAPVCVRVPAAMGWAEFAQGVIDPWAAADPNYDPSAITGWQVDGAAMTPSDGASLADTGVGHKSVVTFRTRNASRA